MSEPEKMTSRLGRGAIRTAFLDGYTYAELAERADVPLGTMKSWIRRGLARLRDCMEHGE